MEVNYLAIFVLAIFSMILGSIWYGPLFGRKWMEIIGTAGMDDATKKEMRKKAMPLYGVQFLLSLFQIFVLAFYIVGWEEASGVENALWIWAAFVIPTLAGSTMWTNDTTRIKWSRFLIQGGYQLILFVVAGCVLKWWM